MRGSGIASFLRVKSIFSSFGLLPLFAPKLTMCKILSCIVQPWPAASGQYHSVPFFATSKLSCILYVRICVLRLFARYWASFLDFRCSHSHLVWPSPEFQPQENVTTPPGFFFLTSGPKMERSAVRVRSRPRGSRALSTETHALFMDLWLIVICICRDTYKQLSSDNACIKGPLSISELASCVYMCIHIHIHHAPRDIHWPIHVSTYVRYYCTTLWECSPVHVLSF